MIPRIAFLLIAAFWIAMNALLWRAEYGSRGSGISVPVDLVCRKILSSPDTSSLTIYQDGQKTGFCEFSTSVGQEMAKLDEGALPPEGIVARAGCQIRFAGNVSVGDFNNRLRFDGRVQFSPSRAWRELNLKLSSHLATMEIHSIAAEQTVHLKITSEGGDRTRPELRRCAKSQCAAARVRRQCRRRMAGRPWICPPFPQAPAALAGNLHWEAHRHRLMIGREPVSAYRLETRVLDHPVFIYVSTLGEILRVELPGGIIATLDQWGKS